ncbi:N-acetyltransferase family protein [Jatrophihabitans sp.]|uniref:GNAT family N-acetyltransferase n=1 Tax=Jatrophihabitans sp. TaxID=1932789 RepID=UPI0030C701CC|nr:GCN5-related N-acetyltransferase [Jatrophihabitans sp.]
MHLVPLTDAHATDVLRIYQAGIDEGNATFETSAPTWPEFSAGKLPEHRFAAVSGSELLGWVVCSATSKRPVYAGVVEHSVYVDPAARGRGVGRALLGALIDSTEAAGIWTLRAGIFPENAASIRLHESAGFRRVGVHERIGLAAVGPHAGRWRDVVLLERRSSVV